MENIPQLLQILSPVRTMRECLTALCPTIRQYLSTTPRSEPITTKALVEMQCNRCGLVDNLTPEQKRAIGESVLFGPEE